MTGLRPNCTVMMVPVVRAPESCAQLQFST
jgi:hypothetical protein